MRPSTPPRPSIFAPSKATNSELKVSFTACLNQSALAQGQMLVARFPRILKENFVRVNRVGLK